MRENKPHRIYWPNAYQDLAYHRDFLNVPLDTSMIPTITEILFKLISTERERLIKAVSGLKMEVNHYKNLLLTEEEVEVKVSIPN